MMFSLHSNVRKIRFSSLRGVVQTNFGTDTWIDRQDKSKTVSLCLWYNNEDFTVSSCCSIDHKFLVMMVVLRAPSLHLCYTAQLIYNSQWGFLTHSANSASLLSMPEPTNSFSSISVLGCSLKWTVNQYKYSSSNYLSIYVRLKYHCSKKSGI